MRLQDCNLDIEAVVSAPVVRNRPEDDWVEAYDAGLIPSSLFSLYATAEFLSFGKAPTFLADPENMLFGYFGMLLRSFLEALREAKDLDSDFVKWHALTYDPAKAALGKPIDKRAGPMERRAFRHLMVSLSGSLDSFADVVAIFFTGRIRGLSVGKSDFSKIENWLRTKLPPVTLIVTPYDHFLHKLHDEMGPLVHTVGSDTDWLNILNLFRNKSAHLGDQVFPITGFGHADGNVYRFLPREWPYIVEKHLKPSGTEILDKAKIREHFIKTLMH